MILVSVKLVYLSTNAVLIRKIKDQAKPHRFRSRSNQILVLEERNLIFLKYFDKANFSIHVTQLAFFVFDVVCQIPHILLGVFALNSSQQTLYTLRGTAFRRNTTTGVLSVTQYGIVLAANTIICPRKSG